MVNLTTCYLYSNIRDENGGRMMKYLLTGATGHLGGHIFNELVELVPSNDITVGVHTISKAE